MADTDLRDLYAKGLAQQRAGQAKAALQIYNVVLRRGGGDAQLMLRIGECHEALRDLERADEAYCNAIARDPDLVAAYRRAISMAERARALALKVGQAEAAEALRHGAAGHHAALGVRFIAKGAFRDAEAEFRAAIALAPEEWAPKVDLGLCLYEQGRLEAAEQTIRAGLSLAPEAALAHFHLGQLRARQDRREEARAAFRRALELDPALALAHAALAGLG